MVLRSTPSPARRPKIADLVRRGLIGALLLMLALELGTDWVARARPVSSIQYMACSLVELGGSHPPRPCPYGPRPREI
jgi:hypothetical protein